MLRLNNLRAQIGRNISLGSPSKFLETIVKSVTTDLLWESCSLFVLDSFDKSILRLMAIYPKPHNLKLINRQSYSISSNSLTSQVFQQNKMLWSYDIDKETRNTHMFNDLTETKPRDWIGVPIAIPGSSPVGVLSVKNRKSADPDRGLLFSKFDMQNIQTVAVDIASILHQYELFSKRKKLADQKAREVREMEDFIKTFRHEIRSPIQAVCYAPERIGVILREEGLITNRSIPKKLREYLLNFKATGNRMEIISKALTLNPDEIVREFKIHNIYKECVAPVFAFCIPYASKKRKYIDVDKDSLFFNMLCDAFALQMAFHVLIDNAIKYSDTNTIINVYGKPIKSGHQVVVESRSKIFSISNEEAKRIKNKYVRGELPREQKLEGSGIGLFLADRIMELHGGSLKLLKKKSPVRFALRLKI
jgi:K+-sensing histidine kinase KdpD